MALKVVDSVSRLAWAAFGLAAAVICGWAVEAASTAHRGSSLWGAAAYAVVWAPLLLSLWPIFRRQRREDAAAVLGLRFRGLDVLWGMGIGCTARAADALIRTLATGSNGLVPQPTVSAIGDLGVQGVALGIVAPVLIAPVLEEVYFRGLIQRGVAAALGQFSAIARWAIAVVITSVVFALVHALLLAGAPAEALLTGAATFFFALLAGTTAAATQRLGGAIVGHVVFNGLGVLLTWPA